MREEFEKLPEIREIMNSHGIRFMNHSGFYEAAEFKDFEFEQYVNGAWYAYQEQQNKISVKDELKELYRKEVDFLRNQTSKAILALYSENKEDALNTLKESIKE